MKFVTNFFQTVKESIYSPEFYAGIPKKSLGSAIIYFLLLTLIVTVLQSVLPIWSFTTVGQQEIQKFIGQAVNTYPEKLEVKIQNGKVSTNVKEPYFIPLPSGNNTSNSTYNLIVIDTKTPFSASQFNAYKAAAWVSKDTIFVQGDSNGQIKTIDLSKASDVKINKSLINSFAVKYSPLLKLLTPLAIVGILLGLFLLHILRLIYLFFLALLIFLLVKVIKKDRTYGECYKISIYAVTLGVLVEFIGNFLRYPGFPFMFTIIAIAVVLFNFKNMKKSSSKMDTVKKTGSTKKKLIAK